jgi:hypothetical protein
MTTNEDEIEYEVEEIRDRRVYDGKIQYFVKWAGYPEASSTWTDESSLPNCPGQLANFFTVVKAKRKKQKEAPKLLTIRPVKFVSHGVDGGRLFFTLLFSDGFTKTLSVDSAKRDHIALLFDYLESITAFKLEN